MLVNHLTAAAAARPCRHLDRTGISGSGSLSSLTFACSLSLEVGQGLDGDGDDDRSSGASWAKDSRID